MLITLLCASSLITLSAIMACAWAFARTPGRSGWIDAIWSLAVGLVGAGFALVPLGGATGPRQDMVAGMVALWALRLGGHIALRTAGHGDDPRYAQLRREWGDRFSARLFLFLQIQALAAWLLVVCVALAAHRPGPFTAWSDGAGALVLMTAVAGEGLADWQLRAFRKAPGNPGGICDGGLWALSRHPNYFCEWLTWLSYALVAIGPDGAWWPGRLALAGPVFMYWLLVHVSGIPPLEAHMLRSRGEAYRAYQKRVNAFWPLSRPSSSGERR
jgi:steroid 5-alpha reductase family enzyme